MLNLCGGYIGYGIMLWQEWTARPEELCIVRDGRARQSLGFRGVDPDGGPTLAGTKPALRYQELVSRRR